jgi:hypothetical protein
LFWLGTVHGITAGADAANRMLWWTYVLIAGTVLFLTVYRILASRRPTPVRRTTARIDPPATTLPSPSPSPSSSPGPSPGASGPSEPGRIGASETLVTRA